MSDDVGGMAAAEGVKGFLNEVEEEIGGKSGMDGRDKRAERRGVKKGVKVGGGQGKISVIGREEKGKERQESFKEYQQQNGCEVKVS